MTQEQTQVWNQEAYDDCLNFDWLTFHDKYSINGISFAGKSRQHYRDNRKQLLQGNATPVFNEANTKIETYEDAKALIKTTVAHRNATLNLDHRQEIIEFVVPKEAYTLPDGTLVPVGFFSSSDWHVGHINCDIEALEQDIETIAKWPWAFFACLGDSVDNTKAFQDKTASTLYEAIISKPSNQYVIVEYLLSLIPKERHICIVQGNHENRDFHAGLDKFEDIAVKLGIPYAGPGAIVRFVVGAQTYTGVLRHKYKNVNGHKTLITNYQTAENLEFSIIGHHHTTSAVQENFKNTPFTALRNGTYLTYHNSPNYEAQNGQQGEYGVSSLLFYPDRHEITTFRNYKTALEALILYRQSSYYKYRDRTYKEKIA